MIVHTVKFKGHHCFKNHWSGLEQNRPINLIIGKNNTGKSHFLEFIEFLCTNTLRKTPWQFKANIDLIESELQRVFKPGSYGSNIHGDHWKDAGRHLVGQKGYWERGPDSATRFVLESTEQTSRLITEPVLQYLADSVRRAHHLIYGKVFKHLLADRDIQPESAHNNLTLAKNGSGATNIIRHFLTTEDNEQFPRDLVRVEMLDALNQIFGEDGHFSEIYIQRKSSNQSNSLEDTWEIYLGQEHKGLVSLSKSGSGLKTIFLVLLHLLAIPQIEGKKLEEYAFAFEELENNLHPSLFRRLLAYLESKTSPDAEVSIKKQPCFFLTTHANVALDYFAGHLNSQIIHITHDHKSAKATTINHSSELLNALRDLGTRPSDLLQANGIIWVEGPSDRIYLNRWIELMSDGNFEEGRHYQIAFYGGNLLSNLQATTDENEDKKLINIMKINPNVIVVSDSDKDSKHGKLKLRVRRIRDEFSQLEKNATFHWILGVKEIENYLTGDLISKTLPKVKTLPNPKQYERMFSGSNPNDKGYLEKQANRKSWDKNQLATLCIQHMEKDTLSDRFDWKDSMKMIIDRIAYWNQ